MSDNEQHGSPKKKGTLQFRSSGPMVLPNYTPAELSRIRAVVSMPRSKIKYVALCKCNDGNLLVFAQANDKLSVKAWRRFLGNRIQHVGPCMNCIEGIKRCQGYELDQDTGGYTRLVQGVTDPAVQCEEFGQTGWSKLIELNNQAELVATNKFFAAQKQAEMDIGKRYITSESVKKMILEGLHCRTIEWMLDAFQASQRAATNAILEFYGLRPSLT